MKKLIFISFIIFSLIGVEKANAQAPCSGIGILGIGPIGIGIIIDCPPPLPPPRVIVLRSRRNPCGYDSRGECEYAPRRRYKPVVKRYAPVRRTYVQKKVSVVTAPSIIKRTLDITVPRLTLGVMFNSASYEDGGMSGGGVYARYLLGKNIGIEASLSGLSSCTNCNELITREDTRTSVSVLYFLGRQKSEGLNFYLKAGLTAASITFNNELNGLSESTSQSSLDFGGGVEWKLTKHFSLNIEGSISNPTSDDEFGTGSLSEEISKGVPGVSSTSTGFNLKIGIGTHF
jgi:opacity protein-like surface antigen